MGVAGPARIEDFVGLYEQAIRVSALAQTTSNTFERAADGVVPPEYDPQSVGEVTELMVMLRDAQSKAAAVELAALEALDRVVRHNELMGGFASSGVDERLPQKEPKEYESPLVKREWYLLTFHEGGHAEWALRSTYHNVGRVEGLRVDKCYGRGPVGSGYTTFTRKPTMNLFGKPLCPSMAEFHDRAVGALSGPVAEAYWLNYVEGLDYRRALRGVYDTGGSSDYWSARALCGDSYRKFRRAEGEAKELIADVWEKLMLMAEEAREKHQLSTEEIKEYA